MKYKVILVDDEEEVLQSIRRKLEWEKYGFEVVETFLNGSDVMEFLETQEADLIITDVRMPFMDGIELAKNISERYPQIKVIIISGYGDFSYAKEAMSYHVSDYILKPVNVKEMCEVLERAKTVMDREREEKRNIHLLEKQYRENLPIIRENILNRLVEGDIQRENIRQELEKCGVSIGDSHYWAAVLIQIDKAERQEPDGIKEQYSSVYIRNLIREKFKEQYPYAIFYSRLGECIIFGMQQPEQIEKILFKLNSVVRESRRTGIYPAVGVGKVKPDLAEMKNSFEEAREALTYRKMAKTCEVIYLEDIDRSEQSYVLLDKKTQEMLYLAVKFGDSGEIRRAVGKVRSRLDDANMNRNEWQAWIVSVMNPMLLFEQQHPALAEKAFKGRLDCLKILSQHKDMDSFFTWMEEVYLRLGAYYEQERTDKTKNIIEFAREYIQRKFGTPDISLEKVAMEIGLTPTYFSSLFKKETGESFVEYLTRIRLEESMRMLKETDEKVYVVAEKSGYPDAGYFSYVFKKKYGITPIQYRRQKSQHTAS